MIKFCHRIKFYKNATAILISNSNDEDIRRRRYLKKILIPLIAVTLCLVFAGQAYALGTIRIEPHAFESPDPMVVSSPATFKITVTEHPAEDPQIFLVMTKACHEGLTGNVVVTWTGGSISFSAADFTAAHTGKAPPSTPDADYTVASLQDHLGVAHSENVYYALGPFLAGPITQTAQTFIVTLPSTAPKMLVYAIGKSSAEYDNRVPNSVPGFVVPEPLPIFMTLASFAALGLFSLRRKRPTR